MADRDDERTLDGIDKRDLKSWHEIGITDPLEIKHWNDLGYRFWLNHSEEFPYDRHAVEHHFPHTAQALHFAGSDTYHADHIQVSPLPFALRRISSPEGADSQSDSRQALPSLDSANSLEEGIAHDREKIREAYARRSGIPLGYYVLDEIDHDYVVASIAHFMSSRILDQWRQEGRNISKLQGVSYQVLTSLPNHSHYELSSLVTFGPFGSVHSVVMHRFHGQGLNPVEDAQRNSLESLPATFRNFSLLTPSELSKIAPASNTQIPLSQEAYNEQDL